MWISRSRYVKVAVMVRVHKAHEVVEHLCRAWTDKEQAHVQSGVIVRELARYGLLTNAELEGSVVIDSRTKQ